MLGEAMIARFKSLANSMNKKVLLTIVYTVILRQGLAIKLK